VTRQADSAIVPWGYPALLLAAVFLNFTFWYEEGREFPFHGPTVWYLIQVFGGAILLGALFFWAPALGTQASKRSLFQLAEKSLGSIGTLVLRVCCAGFLVVWLAVLFWMIAQWLLFGRRAPATAQGITAGILAVLLFWFGRQSLRTVARLAFLTNVLGVALLVAAVIRVRVGWPEALHAMARQGWMVETADLWRGLAQIAFWAAPLLFLASDFGQRCEGRKQVHLIGVFGIVLPAAGVLLTTGFIERAMGANIAAVLASGHAVRYAVAVEAVTMFGMVGFGARALMDRLSVLRGRRSIYWTLLGLAVCTIGVLASILFLDVSSVLNPLARCLVAAAAVMTADFLTGRWRTASTRKIDWIGVTAFLIGWGLPYLTPEFFVLTGFYLGIGADSPLQDPWLLRTYVVSFSICLLCGIARKAFKRVPKPAQSTPHSI